MASNTRQITLHFNGDNKAILEHFEKMARPNFRSTEQEILFQLSSDVRLHEDIDKHVDEHEQISKLDVLPPADDGALPL